MIELVNGGLVSGCSYASSLVFESLCYCFWDFAVTYSSALVLLWVMTITKGIITITGARALALVTATTRQSVLLSGSP